MRAAWFICLFLALAFVIDVHEASPDPKRRGGGSRRGSSSYPSSNSKPKNNYGEYIYRIFMINPRGNYLK